MAIKINNKLSARTLLPRLDKLFELSGEKILNLEKTWDPARGTPVFTVKGKYTTRGWTEWTQGFQYGSMILAFDATDQKELIALSRKRTIEEMAVHVSHTGVHDHGFNNLSTYGNLRRLMRGGRIPHNEWELNFYELALKATGRGEGGGGGGGGGVVGGRGFQSLAALRKLDESRLRLFVQRPAFAVRRHDADP